MSPGPYVCHTTDRAQLGLLNGVSNPGTAGGPGDVCVGLGGLWPVSNQVSFT